MTQDLTKQINIKSVPLRDDASCGGHALALGVTEQSFYRRLIHWASMQDTLTLHKLFTEQQEKDLKSK
jgi:hypothetical protein